MAEIESNGRARPATAGWDQLLQDVMAVPDDDQRDVETLLWDAVALLDEIRAASDQLRRTHNELRCSLAATRAALEVAP